MYIIHCIVNALRNSEVLATRTGPRAFGRRYWVSRWFIFVFFGWRRAGVHNAPRCLHWHWPKTRFCLLPRTRVLGARCCSPAFVVEFEWRGAVTRHRQRYLHGGETGTGTHSIEARFGAQTYWESNSLCTHIHVGQWRKTYAPVHD
jgi:hypothetical protein